MKQVTVTLSDKALEVIDLLSHRSYTAEAVINGALRAFLFTGQKDQDLNIQEAQVPGTGSSAPLPAIDLNKEKGDQGPESDVPPTFDEMAKMPIKERTKHVRAAKKDKHIGYPYTPPGKSADIFTLVEEKTN